MRLLMVTGLLLILITPASGLTRQESVLDFVDSTRLSESGFANTPSDAITLEATFHALEIKFLLFDEVNNSLDILYYVQRLQNESGGFAPDELSDIDLVSTITAVRLLPYLPVNQTQYINWEIYPYFNQTITPLLWETFNGTTNLKDLSSDRLGMWIDYISISTRLGVLPSFPILELLDEVKSLQFSNGSYTNIELAIESINLLNMLGDAPVDADLASKFILSFTVPNGAFSTDNEHANLEITYEALIALSKLLNLNQLDGKDDITRYVFNLQDARSGFRDNLGQVTLHSTHHAISILAMLGELDELLAPDVLQEVGFITFPWSTFLIFPVINYAFRRRYNE